MFGQATETLNPATSPGTYSNIMITATESTTVNSVPVTLTVQWEAIVVARAATSELGT